MIEPNDILSVTMLFAVSVALAGAAMWAGGRLTPWFLREAIEAPSVRALILAGDHEVPFRVRIAASGLAFAVMLAVLLAIIVGARVMGWHTN